LPFITQRELIEFNMNPCNDGFNKMLVKRGQKCDRETCIGRNGQTYKKNDYQYFYSECGAMEDCEEPLNAVISGLRESQGKFVSGTCLMNDGLGEKCFTSN